YNVLAFMEQDNLRNLADLKMVVETTPPWMNCPTRRAARPYKAGPTEWQPFWTGTLSKATRNDYAINGGTIKMDRDGSNNKKAPPQPLLSDGVAGSAALILLADVRDGTSNTYLVGEKYVMPDHYEDAGDLGDNENAY